MIFLGGKEIEQSQYLTIFELPELKVFTGFFEGKKIVSQKLVVDPNYLGPHVGIIVGSFSHLLG